MFFPQFQSIFSQPPSPQTLLKSLEQHMANFFWEEEDGSMKRHWKWWHALCRLTSKNGLGLQNLEDVVSAFSIKLWWNYFTSSSLWAVFMYQKYSLNGNAPNPSPSWTRMQKIRELALKNIQKLIRNGESSFWHEKWSCLGVLSERKGIYHNATIKVKDLYSNKAGWNLKVVHDDILVGEVTGIRGTKILEL
ncbi:hypothetical protein ACH5RR_029529 [Cinchona calisaya]|uniref:Uncharacterized protein n=1 Tax=Cinchona calisaya TaxID=153742 RepID=A0ABD2YT42_9GENT